MCPNPSCETLVDTKEHWGGCVIGEMLPERPSHGLLESKVKIRVATSAVRYEGPDRMDEAALKPLSLDGSGASL